MKGLRSEEICPRCREGRLKSWNELSDEQRMLAERLPYNTGFSSAQRKKHRFCERCWFESVNDQSTNA